MGSPDLDLSVVLPVFNEVASLRPLMDEIRAALDPTGRSYEVICCDDGSTDGSQQMLRELAAQDGRIKVLAFARNFGQTAALDAGFQIARGRVVVPMDADLQNDPADIPRLLARLEQDAEAVSGWRVSRKDSYWTKTLPSRLANHLVSWTTGVELHDYGCTLKAYKADVLKEFRLYGEMHRLIPAYVAWAGGRVVEMPVNHRERRFGTSKYNLSKTVRLLLDLVTVRFLLSYSTKPLYFMGKYGLLTLGVGFLTFLWVLVKRLVWGHPLYTDPFFLVSVFLLMAGGQFVLTGLLAELSMRTYFESRGKAPWRIRWAVNVGDQFPAPPVEDTSRRTPPASAAVSQTGSHARPSGAYPIVSAAQPVVSAARPTSAQPALATPPHPAPPQAPAPAGDARSTTNRHPLSGFALPPAAAMDPSQAPRAATPVADPAVAPTIDAPLSFDLPAAPGTPPAPPPGTPASTPPGAGPVRRATSAFVPRTPTPAPGPSPLAEPPAVSAGAPDAPAAEPAPTPWVPRRPSAPFPRMPGAPAAADPLPGNDEPPSGGQV